MLAFKAIRGAGWLVLSRFVGRIIDFFTLLVLARLLAPSDFGVAALATSLVVVVDMILEVPVTQALVRLRSIDKSHLDTGFTLGCLRSIVVAVVVFAVAWPFSLLHNDKVLLHLVSVLAIGPIAKGLTSPAMVHFSRALRFRPAFILELSGKIGACVVVALVVMAGGTYWAIVSNFSTAAVISTALSYVLAPYRPRFSLSQRADFVGFIRWFSAAQVLAAFNWQSDRFLLGGLGDKTSLGRYAVANDISVIPSQSIIGPAMQPVMAAFSQVAQDPERMKLAFLKAARFVMLISIPVCFGISLTADLVADILLGPQWKSAAPLLSVLAISVAPFPYFQTLHSASMALDRPVVIFKLNAIELCFKIPLLPAGFYLGSAYGVSISRLTIALILFVFYLIYASRLLSLGIIVQLKNIWKILTAGVVMAVCVLLLRSQLTGVMTRYDVVEMGLVAATGAMVYGLTLVALGEKLQMR
ncbi:lipopolysaccharide biosynthesis protein [Rhizobium sp. 16-449-1b]|uniref:lipopolysaccharide biosynthesis protein n=1 Tax=Rhizobium sp. 16-449-1b TaxID=2819989 RepID=UPI000645A8A7|nr:lipopolysaccharide biosynthesis protein [Rhizobium sp. 16-449-1b]MBO9196856.1 lipopolysaccharide biosynthesis protein [Rhizobium sp. 16-449-1b]